MIDLEKIVARAKLPRGILRGAETRACLLNIENEFFPITPKKENFL